MFYTCMCVCVCAVDDGIVAQIISATQLPGLFSPKIDRSKGKKPATCN